MTKVKYTGAGMLSRGINFSPTKTNGLYDLSVEDAKYFLETFPRQFELIERAVEKEEKVVEKKPRTRRARKKSTDTPED